jgi:phospholipase/lecithinase/hemolysin
MAAEYNAIHVPFQQAFNNALANAPAEYWIWDGIHPMPAGHELMAIEWMQQVTKELKFIK